MKTKLIFFDMEFTSLSPDAQIISLGAISDCGKSIYAEFSDFDLNRCDDWVKENVVGKLILGKAAFPTGKITAKHISLSDGGDYLLYQKEWENGDHETLVQFDNSPMVCGNTIGIKQSLILWLAQFSDYNIQFICDCGTFDWYWMLQLIGEWENAKYCAIKNTGKCQVKLGNIEKCPSKMYLNGWDGKEKFECQAMFNMRFGLPKLPSNISPVPEDLNDLIALKKGISVKEAFDLNRELEAIEFVSASDLIESSFHFTKEAREKALSENSKHNALWDAKVIKAIYEKLS